MDLNGKIALVTGSTDGVGRLVARRLAEQGARVLIHGRDHDRGKQLVDQIQSNGSGSAVFLRADFSSLAEVRRLAESVRQYGNHIHLLINNAGIGSGGAAGRRETSQDGYELRFAVSGFVNSLSRPGGNVTGLSLQGPDLAGKRLELLRELVPGRRRLAILVNVGYPAAKEELAQVQTAAHALGLESAVLEIRRAEDIAPAFDGAKGRADALYVVGEALVSANVVLITKLALDAGLPAISTNREFAVSGGLIAYGPSVPALFQRAADVVDKILRGAKPADIPVQQPTKFDLVINLKSGKALGLTVPQTLLATADEVIE